MRTVEEIERDIRQVTEEVADDAIGYVQSSKEASACHFRAAEEEHSNKHDSISGKWFAVMQAQAESELARGILFRNLAKLAIRTDRLIELRDELGGVRKAEKESL